MAKFISSSRGQSSVFEVQCLSLVSIIELKLINLNSVSARLAGGGVEEERGGLLMP